MKNNCIFCAIAAGEIPSFKVYEDDVVLAYLDINPFSKGHVLVIPKEHTEGLLDTPDATLAAVVARVKKVAAHIKDALPNGQVVPPGKGTGNVAAIVKAYGQQGGKILSLEPHLTEFVGLKSLEQPGEASIVGQLQFASAEAAFDHAAQTLYQILEEL